MSFVLQNFHVRPVENDSFKYDLETITEELQADRLKAGVKGLPDAWENFG